MSSKAQRSRIIKSDVLVVGIDVAKRRHVAVCRRPDGFKEKPFSFTNQRCGFEKLLNLSQDSERRNGCNSLLFALEATGHYGQITRPRRSSRRPGSIRISSCSSSSQFRSTLSAVVSSLDILATRTPQPADEIPASHGFVREPVNQVSDLMGKCLRCLNEVVGMEEVQ